MEKILIMGHKNPDVDSICSSLVMENFLEYFNVEAEAVRLGEVSKEAEYILDYLGIESQRKIDSVEKGQKVILVDHNDVVQGAKGIKDANVLAVIDHHRVSNFSTLEPLYYLAEPVGCTATILFRLFEIEKIKVSRKNAILMLGALISDTLLLKSPTCTVRDVQTYKKLEKIAEIDAEKFGVEILKAGTDLSSYTFDEIINLDAKEVIENGKRIVVSQINTLDISKEFTNKDEYMNVIMKQSKKYGIDLFIFMITDIINANSKILVYGNNLSIVEDAFGKKLDDDNSMFLEDVVSKKKQIMPQILSKI